MRIFSYPTFNYNGRKIVDIKEEFLYGWCHLLQYRLIKELPDAEPYEIWEKSSETNNEFWNDHQIIKYKGFLLMLVVYLLKKK